MLRHGPVIEHCTDSEDFPKSRIKIMRSCVEKICEIISAQAEMRESHMRCVRLGMSCYKMQKCENLQKYHNI